MRTLAIRVRNYSFRAIFAVILSLIISPAMADLEFSFHGDQTHHTPGEQFILQWVVTNTGSNNESNLAVSLPYPAGINSLSDSLTDSGACPSISCEVGETVVWTIGTLAAGQSRVATFAPTVGANTLNGLVQWVAELTQGGTSVETISWGQTVSSSSVLEASIESDRALVPAGEELTYTINLGNTSNTVIGNGIFTAAIPANMSLVSAPGASVSGNSVSWALGNVSDESTLTRFLTLATSTSLPTGQLIRLDGTFSGQANGLVQSSTASHTVSIGDSTLRMALRVHENSESASGRYQVELVLGNFGTQTQTNVSVALFYSPKLASISDSLTANGACPSISCQSGEFIVWNFANILPGETMSLRFQPQLSSGALLGSPTKWHARLQQGSNVVQREFSSLNITNVVPNLSITATDTLVEASDEFTYEIAFSNDGSAALSNGVINIPIPEGISVVNAPGATVTADSVEWALSNIADGEYGERRLDVVVSNQALSGELIKLDRATFTATSFGLEQSTAAEHIQAIGSSPLRYELQIQQGTVRPNEGLHLRVVVSNTGNQPEQDVIASLLYPDGLNSISESLIQGGVCPSISCVPGETVFWNFGTLLPGESRSISFNPIVSGNASTGSTIDWQGSVLAANRKQLRMQATTGVTDTVANLGVTSSENLVQNGDVYDYTINYGNDGIATLTQASLELTLPDTVSLVSAPGANVVGNSLMWTIGDVIADTVGTVTVQVQAAAGNGELIVLDDVRFSGTFFGLQHETFATHVVSVGSSPIEVDIQVSPVFRLPGEQVVITLQVVNTSAQVAQDVDLTLLYPHGLSSISETNADGGICPSISCEPSEHIFWTFGNLLPGETGTVTISPNVTSAQSQGDMLELYARARTSLANFRRADEYVLIGSAAPPVTTGFTCMGFDVTVNIGAGQSPTSGDDVILGTSGVDIIDALEGNDIVCAGAGDDVIFGQEGNDRIDGEGGNDEIFGRAGADILIGGSGDDRVFGGNGDDTVSGEGGDDFVTGQGGADNVSGGAGADTVVGGLGVDFVSGGAGDDVLRGQGGGDLMDGGAGFDLMFGGSGNDVMATGPDGGRALGNGNNDTITGSSVADQLEGNSGLDEISGGGGDDIINGGNGADMLFGEGGNDQLTGAADADRLFGGAGLDTLLGGTGNDSLDGGTATDTCNGQGGTDTAVACEVVTGVP